MAIAAEKTSYAAFLWQNRRWLAGGLLLTLFSSFGQTYFIALFSGNIRSDFQLSHGDFGQLYMLATLASALTLLWLGKALDHFKISIITLSIFAGLACCSLGMGLVSGIPGLLLTLFGLRLFGQGMMTHTAMTAMGKWYVAARGRAVACTGMGYHIGEGLMPLLVVSAMSGASWRNFWLGGAVVLLLTAPLVAALFWKERVPGSEEAQLALAGKQWTRPEVLADPLFWVLCLGILAPAFIGTSHFFHLVHITQYKQWSVDWAAKSFLLLSVMTITWTLVSGWLVDKHSARQLLPFFLVPLGIGCLVLSSSNHLLVLFVFMALLGVSYGISSSLFGALWPEIYGTSHLGSIRAMAVAAMVLASALGPGVTGSLIDAGVTYNIQLVAMGTYALLGSVAMFYVARKLERRV